MFGNWRVDVMLAISNHIYSDIIPNPVNLVFYQHALQLCLWSCLCFCSDPLEVDRIRVNFWPYEWSVPPIFHLICWKLIYESIHLEMSILKGIVHYPTPFVLTPPMTKDHTRMSINNIWLYNELGQPFNSFSISVCDNFF